MQGFIDILYTIYKRLLFPSFNILFMKLYPCLNNINDKYYKRIDSNKSGYTKTKCTCGRVFGIASDMTGDMVGFDLDKQVYNMEICKYCGARYNKI